MKKFYVVLLILLFTGLNISFGQEIIWEEDFDYPTGTISATKDGISWEAQGLDANYDDAGANQGPYGIGVVNGEIRGRQTRLEGNLTGNDGDKPGGTGLTTWEITTPIDISNFSDVNISLDIFEEGVLEDMPNGGPDFIQVQYMLDGGSWTDFDNNGYVLDDFEGTTDATSNPRVSRVASQNGICGGSSLRIRVIIQNWFWIQGGFCCESHYFDNIEVNGVPEVIPDIVSGVFPGENSVDVCYVGTNAVNQVEWATLATGDCLPVTYNFSFGTDPNDFSIEEFGLVNSSFDIPLLDSNTTYYCKVVSINDFGSSEKLWQFTTAEEECPDYCDENLNIGEVGPITSVKFADIDNQSPNYWQAQFDLEDVIYEDFTSISASVINGDSYVLKLRGQTQGQELYFTAWFDWNQNGNFEEDEQYNVGEVQRSSGLSELDPEFNTFSNFNAPNEVYQEPEITIEIPQDALPGFTLMRIKSNRNGYSDNACEADLFNNPDANNNVNSTTRGQVEDYTLQVCELPEAITQNITRELDSNCEITITTEDINNGSTAGCTQPILSFGNGSTSLTYDLSVFSDEDGLPFQETVIVDLYATDQFGNTDASSATLTLVRNVVDFANIQFPADGEICQSESFTVFGRVFEPGLTDANSNVAPGIQVDFGLNSVNGNPALWNESSWAAAIPNPGYDFGQNDDEYQYTVTPSTSGTFYYAFRYSLDGGCTYRYGATNNGFWNGSGNNNGVLTVNEQPIWFADADGDGFGDVNETTQACDAPNGYVADNTDCDDTNASINPGESETYFNDIDDDCNPDTLDFNSGIFESFVVVNDNFYDLESNTGNPDFEGANLGNFSCDTGLEIDGGQNKIFKCSFGDGDVINGTTFYRIYPINTTPPGFNPINLAFGSDDGVSNVNSDCQNQTWQTLDANLNLLADLTNSGTYVLEVYNSADYTFNTGSGTHTANNSGNNFKATFTYTDNPPVASASPFTVQLDNSGAGSISAGDIDNGSSDDCGIASIELIGQKQFSCDDVGEEILVSLSVTDTNGVTSISNQVQITVEDNVSPNAVAQDVTVQLDANGNGSTTAQAVDNGSNDACGIASLVLSQTDFDCSDVGANPVTLTVTDVNGNVSTATATVTVEDSVSPNAIAQDVTVQLDANGNGGTTAQAVDNGSNDNCGIASLVLSQTDFDCSDVGANPVTLTVTDVNGNVSTATATVTVVDNVAPNAIAQDVTVQLDANGNGSTTAQAVDNGSNDNCGIASLVLSQTDFDCSDVGANPVTLTVTDVNGNVSTATATVTVEDNVDPVAIAQDVTVQLDDNGIASIVPSDIDNGSNDACGIQSLALDVDSFGCGDIGSPLTVTLTVTDNNNNVSTATALVTVFDEIAPVIACPEVQVFLDGSGSGSLSIEQIRPFLEDNCTPQAQLEIELLTNSVFDCSFVGDNLPELIVSQVINGPGGDDYIEIFNGTGEAIDLASYSIQSDNGNAQLSGIIGVGESRVFASSVFPISFPTAGIGFFFGQEMEFTFKKSGNVIDAVSYTGEVNLRRNSTVGLGSASFVVSEWEVLSGGPLDYGNLLFHSVESQSTDVDIKVTDNNGNESECTVSVTVIDDQAPTAIAQDITVELDATGNASIDGGDINNGSSDACNIAGLEVIGQSTFNCSDIGEAIFVSLLVTDSNGNSSESPQVQVTVVDNVNPIALTNDITIQLDANGNASITTADIDAGSNDACGIDSLELDVVAFSCGNVGENTVELTVTDNNGNVSTATATVTVEDSVAPTATAQDITVEILNGTASITAGDIDNGSNDACGIAGLAIEAGDQSTFDCSDIGNSYTVTLVVTDNNGNSATADAQVTVEGIIPSVGVSESELPEFCQGAFIELTATSDVPNVSYLWDTGETTATIEVDANGPYTVTVTSNVSGCSTEVTYTVSGFDSGDLQSSYTILATEKVDLQDSNTVESGGVGVTGTNGLIRVRKASSIAGFAQAQDIQVDNSSSVATAINSPAGAPIPQFLINNQSTSSSQSISFNGNNNTLQPGVYNQVQVKQNATVTLPGGDYYIKEFKTFKDANVIFGDCANLFIQDQLKVEEDVDFNWLDSQAQQVTIYVDNDVQIKRGARIRSRIHANDNKIQVIGKKNSDNVEIRGQFIAREIKSARNVVWNTDTFCIPCSTGNTATVPPAVNPGEGGFADASINVLAYPNPAKDNFNIEVETEDLETPIDIRVYDMYGKRVDMSSFSPREIFSFGRLLEGGVYIVKVSQNGQVRSVKLTKM